MPWQPPRSDRTKSLVLVAGLHLLLGAALVSGLAGDRLDKTVENAFQPIFIPPPVTPEPEPPPPPPSQSEPAAREEAGAVDVAAKPAPVVLPPPPRPLPSANPLPTADEAAADTGSAPSAGAGLTRGDGRGAGGEGNGAGGGGSGGTGAGGGSGLGSDARLVSGNLTRRDYRRIRAFGSPRGQAVLAIDVSADGRLTRCLPLGGSGNPALDAELCRLLERTRWEPARDRAGRPVPVALRYVATWDRD
jgi:protein TonB